jgi:hypothetical protein
MIMSNELWAAYSVKDHRTPRTFATDLMLFDRLVFPVPEKVEVQGNPIGPGPVRRKRNEGEWKRWLKEDWDPEGQEQLLQWLNPVVRRLPWSSEGPLYDEYRMEAARLAAKELPDYAFQATRTVLTRDLPAYVTGVAAFGPAYHSVDEVKRVLKIREAGEVLPGGTLASVLAWEFFAPDPDDLRLTDKQLLEETLAFVTGDEQFRARRRAFVEWQQKFLRRAADGGPPVTDNESVRRAVEEMSDLLADANKAARRLALRKIAKYAFRLAPCVLSAAAIAHGVAPLWPVVGGGFLGLGGIAVEEKLFKSAEETKYPSTAFIYDAQRHFGWR